MAYWGTGTKEDPYVCDTWDSLVDRCANSDTGSEIYVEMAAKTQQGVLIPVSERVIDMRKWNWFLSDGTGGALVVPFNRRYPIHINGNDWTILGASLRDCRLIVFRYNDVVSYVENFTFKNIYLQVIRVCSHKLVLQVLLIQKEFWYLISERLEYWI